jgi:hypothetical protein
MADELSLNDVIESLEDETLTNAEVAELVVEVILGSEPEVAGQYLISIVTSAVWRVRRGATRAVEQEADYKLSHGVDPVAARKDVVGKTFWIPVEHLVLWATASVEQHQARVEYMQWKMIPFKEDIARHRKAIKDITDGGVECLADLCPALLASH